MSAKVIRRRLLIVLLYISLPLILALTNPQKLPLPLVTLPLILTFLIIFSGVYFLIGKYTQGRPNITKTRRSVISGICALFPVLLVMLASINQFTTKDVILTVGLMLCMSWYLLKVDFSKYR
ncbi:MAG TPA: hypothetical protein VMR34_06195 [Candidatus Saccharimonadales bacterium]|nr:hypothetical protein [Candidatus Saccharimonadales bacterium]